MDYLTQNPFEVIHRELADLRSEIRKLKDPKTTGANQTEWGGVDFASQITGYAHQTIYIKAGKGQIPHIKRDGKLWFEKTALIKYIETGVIQQLDKIDRRELKGKAPRG